jgi:soluble lytic murein transglycosylase-like protein
MNEQRRVPRGPWPSREANRALRTGLSAAAMGLALGCFPDDARAQIYAGRSNETGAIVLSNFMSREANVLVIEDPVSSSQEAAGPRAEAPVPRRVTPELQRRVESAAARSAISSELLHAVIAAESNYDVGAVSRRGAIGLMQLLPATAKRFGADDPFDPDQNIAAGASYLKWLMQMFGDDLELVLAAYNAGEQAVLKAGRRIPPYPETQAYVKKVMASLQRATSPSLWR